MGAKNKVIAGDYQGKMVLSSFGLPMIQTGFIRSVNLDKTTLEDYEVMDESHQKSAVSAVGRGLVGGLILGPVG